VSKPKIPFKHGRKFCIFCGAPADSEEHVWPDWAKHILPHSVGHRRFILNGHRRTGLRVRKGYNRQGAVNTFRIKRVCQPCNNGWMSGYETRVRLNLERMIQGQRVFLDAEAARTLAEYITYKIMLVDWLDEDPVIPSGYAHNFYQSRALPSSLRIWLFNCVVGGWRLALHSEAVGIAPIEEWRSDIPPNTKSFSIGFGDLFVFAVVSSEGEVNFEFEGPASLRLWPLGSELLVWPPRNVITSDDAQFVCHALQRLGNSPGVIDMGPLMP
jgi:hypothetical protein